MSSPRSSRSTRGVLAGPRRGLVRWLSSVAAVLLVATALTGVALQVEQRVAPAQAADPTGSLDLREWVINGCTYNEQNTDAANQTPCVPNTGWGSLPWLPSERAQSAAIQYGTRGSYNCGDTDNYIAASNNGSASVSASGIDCPTDADQDGPNRSTSNLLASTFSGTDANGFPDLPSKGANNPYLTSHSAQSATCTQTTFSFTDVSPKPGGSCQASQQSTTQSSWSIVEGWIQFPAASSGSVTIRQNNTDTNGTARAQYTALMVSSDSDPANLQFQGEAQTQGDPINIDFTVPVPTSAPSNDCQLPVRYVRLYIMDQNAASAARLTWNTGGGFTTIPSSALSNQRVTSACGGVSKALTSGPTQNADGTHTVGYRLSMFNPNSDPMTNVQLTDSITASPATFPAGTTVQSATVTPSAACASWATNGSFNATSSTNIFQSSNTLAGVTSGTATRCSVDVTLRVRLPSGQCGAYDNSARMTYTVGGTTVTDVSNDATSGTVDDYTSADPNENGNAGEAGEDTPTSASFTCASISLTKTAAPATYGAGDTVTYTFRATNDGNSALNNVRITDTGLPGVTISSCTPASGSTLAAGATMTCTATKTMTQADVDAGSVINTASTSGTSPGGVTVTDTDDETVTAPADPSLSLTKTADVTTYELGDTVTYDFVARNTGNVTLTNVSISDTGLPGVSIAPASCTPAAPTTLAPGATLTCEATKTITQADIDAGAVVNTATATGSPPTGSPVTGTDNEIVTGPARSPDIELTKTADTDVYHAGDTVTYEFVATNTGNVTLSGVTISDTGLTGVTVANADCTPTAPASLGPGDTMTCTAAKTMTEDDVAAGSVVNTAVVTGKPPSGPDVTDSDDESVLASGLQLEKTAEQATYELGDEVTYDFVTTNVGTETITDVTITDTGLPGVTIDPDTCTPAAPAVLGPDDTMTCTATKTITQADVDAGAVVNTAETTGTPPTGPPATDTDDETITGPDPDPSIELTKTADPTSYSVPGDEVDYEFVATNTGNVTLSDVTITDTGLPGVTIDPADCTPAAPAVLGPDDTMTCTATKTITQADVDAGSVVNTAETSGTPPTGEDVTDTDDETVIGPDPDPSIELTKTADTDPYAVDDVVTYEFVATNTGNVTLSDVTITDTGLPGVTIDPADCTPAAPAALGPDDTMTCTATKTITQADVDAGSVVNTAETSGTPPTGEDVTDTDDETITSPPEPAIELTKTADTDPYAVDDVVTYEFVATNTGNVTLSDVTITDTGLPGVTIDPADCTPAAPAVLGPQETLTCEATKTMTQADVDAGSVVNTAETSGTPPTGADVTDTDDETITSPPEPALELTKTADPTSYTAPGDEVVYEFVATNTGNVTLSDVSITDTGVPGVTIDPDACTPAAPAVLGPDDTMTCTATKTITQADVDAGAVVNTAEATGTPPQGVAVTGIDDETVTGPEPDPSIELAKTALQPTYVWAGDVTTYEFVATNTGNVTLSDVTITDTGLPGVTVDPADCTPAAPAVLGPDDTMTCTATKTATQADVDAGAVINTAETSGTPPTGDDVTDTDDETTTAPSQPAIELTKTADTDPYAVGDVVTYEFVATNTGNVTLSDVSIIDTGLPGVTIDPDACTPAAPAVLGPDETLTCTATKTITQDDVDAGSVVNTAATTGTPPTGEDVTATADETITSPPEPAIELTKTADLATYAVGDVLTYEFVATNTGNVTLSDVTVTDTGLPGVTVDPADCTPAAPAVLGPGETLTCTAAKKITRADVDAGTLVNTAETSGTPPTGKDVTATDDETVPAAGPLLELVKTAEPNDTDGDGEISPGETITYTFVVTNTGNVGLKQVTIADDLLDGRGIKISCPATTLAPEESMTCTSKPYEVTAQDGERSVVHNEASVSGCPLPSAPAAASARAACIDAGDEVDVDVVAEETNGGGSLPGTGGPSPWWYPAGALSVIVGLGLLLTGLRRRRVSEW